MSRFPIFAALLLAACGADRLTAPPSFTTDAFPILIGAGDIAGCTSTSKEKKTGHIVDSTLRANPTAQAFTIGDNVYPTGLAVNWPCYQAAWGMFKARTWFSLGNHEYKKDTTATGYYNYVLGTGVDSTANGVRRKGYHVHDVGAWRVYFLNSERNVDEQTAWLTADLAANPRLCQLMIFHRPLHSDTVATGGGGELNPATELRPWHMAFWQAKGDIVLNGHHHFYRSTYNIRPDTMPGALLEAAVMDTSGYRLFIEGGGGQSQLSVLPAAKPYDRKRLRTWGVLKLTLAPTSYSWQALDTLGHVLDHGTRGCH